MINKDDLPEYHQLKNNDDQNYHIKNITYIDDKLKEFIIDNNILVYSEYHNSKFETSSIDHVSYELNYYTNRMKYMYRFLTDIPIFVNAFIIINDDELLYYDLLFADKENE